MTNKYIALLAISLFLTAIIACSNPLRSSRSLYNCKNDLLPNPKTAEDFVKLGINHGLANERDCALAACNEAIRIDPKYAPGYSCRANHTEDDAAALKDFNQAITLDPKLEEAYFGRSRIYDRQGDRDAALNDANTGIGLCQQSSCPPSTLAAALSNRAELFIKKNDFDRALADYSEAIRLNPKFVSYYAERATLYRKIGRTDLADADQLKAAELSESTTTPSDTNSKNQGITFAGFINDRATSLPEPAYPPVARSVRATGQVEVTVVVNESGEVTDATAKSGHPMLMAAAVAAARRARFKPLMKDGKAVKYKGVVQYNFTLPT